jgi:hypothetical protein
MCALLLLLLPVCPRFVNIIGQAAPGSMQHHVDLSRCVDTVLALGFVYMGLGYGGVRGWMRPALPGGTGGGAYVVVSQERLAMMLLVCLHL